MIKYIFDLKNTTCSYSKGGKTVLAIDELKISTGKMVFITGASGTGKSTILESLGLMNNTLHNLDSKALFEFNPEDTTIDYTKIWGKSDYELSLIRSSYFAFIFQSSNLIPYISIYQNLSLLLDLKGIPKSEHAQLIEDMLNNVGLNKEIKPETMPSAISGGQKQRVSIARALLSNPRIVFGDEPTGSLDRPNARKIFSGFKQLCEYKKTTAIIVSHDIDLTLEFADEIVIIDKQIRPDDSKSFYGRIKSDCHYRKNLDEGSWIDVNSNNVKMGELLLTKIKGVNEA